jgi:regulator of protease activity HflC (stomatin/prohibitin superfamily)
VVPDAHLVAGIYTVDQNERAVKTIFGRAERLTDAAIDDPYAEYLRPEERERYRYPRWSSYRPADRTSSGPGERIYKVSVATQTMNMALDLENPMANQGGTKLEAVTKDQLNIALEGQIRYRVYERNLYAYLWGVKTRSST